MKPIKIMLLKRHLKKQLAHQTTSDQQKATIRLALDDRKALRAAALHVAQADNGKVGQLGDGALLKWLFDHRAEILEFIKQIIEIFA